MADGLWFEWLANATGHLSQERAPASLKSKVYSALVTRMADFGSLLDLRDTKDAGGHLCLFENALTVLPMGSDIRSMNPCRICHARVPESAWSTHQYSGGVARTQGFTTARTDSRVRRGSESSSVRGVPAA